MSANRLFGILRAAAFGGAVALSVLPARADQNDLSSWNELKSDLFADRPMADGSKLIRIDAPVRAQDAGLVPITVEALAPQRPDWSIKSITLVVDNNPTPVVAVFHLGVASGLATIGTRIRINEYSHVRAIAELGDGSLYEVNRYVKASGGCSAPAMKNEEQAVAQMGKMLLRHHPAKPVPGLKDAEIASATLHVRHPNFSGMQKHPTENYMIPEHYIKAIAVSQDGKELLTVDGSIALSEDPTVKFHYDPNAGPRIEVKVEDSRGLKFERTWPSEERDAPGRQASAKEN